jgi:hypothetical protein
MISSKLRPVVVPQLDHSRLAGALASLWGNAEFQRPPVDAGSFVAGVSLHDRGYGPIDAHDLFAISLPVWLEITRRGFHAPCSDPVADLIVKYHLRRLAGNHDLAAEMTEAIREQHRRHNLDVGTFERIDRITNLCDRIALAFCIENPAQGQVSIFRDAAGSEEVPMRFKIDGSAIGVAPWPFSVDAYESFVIAYRASNYPDVLDPVVIPVHLDRSLGVG